MAKWRVMTVDDSAAILTIIAAYLEDSEFEVIAAERDGIMAVERFAQERPDIVLLDLIMPGQSGVETLGRILAIDPDAFVVIVSSLGTEEAVHECLTSGARSFLQKPFTRDDFIDFMRDLTQVA
ncbi:MAG: response regulator [Acidobacteria bacterium]|jgi:two-component system chemotaxis response regulator CheY|nr:response regulator [Candidatus Sulfomarinibacter kjeldsenii]MBD3856713.1 response regulator [Candidatus Sulfomarinibacter kjeldsenii]